VPGLPELRGKVAVVTGGASGIGKGIAGAFLAEGMEVVIADIEEPVLEATAAELGAVGIRTDVSDPASVQALADETLERFGAVHVVCNNAGVGPFGPMASATLNDWRWLIDVNLWGVIHGVTTFLPILERNADGGHIVNTGSAGGLLPVPGLGPYCATKFGVVALTETLAIELAQTDSRVGVTVLCPGAVRTNLKTSSRNRPAALTPGALEDHDAEEDPGYARVRWLDPPDVGAIVVDAIKRGELYAITHPEGFPRLEQRHARLAEAFSHRKATVA
jgi:NAD(P)-dependent dehydrogenase (short-subunit alcohol dehydrogenase family)